MRLRKKILLTSFVTLLLLFTSLAGTLLYFYFKPSAIKPFLEEFISRSTGRVFTIKELSYSIRPLMFQTKGLSLQPTGNQQGFQLEVQELLGVMALEGPFGKRRLTFKKIMIDGLSVTLSKGMGLPGAFPGGPDGSFLSRLIKRAVSLFLFKSVAFHEAEIINGRVRVLGSEYEVEMSGVKGKLGPERRLEITSAVEITWPAGHLRFQAPVLHMRTDRAISLAAPEIGASVTVKAGTFKGMGVDGKGVGVEASLIFNRELNTLALEPMDLDLKEITLEGESGWGKGISGLHLRSVILFRLRDRHLDATEVHLNIPDLLELQGKMGADLGPQNAFSVEILEGHLTPQKVRALLSPKIKRIGVLPRLSGPVGVKGSIKGKEEEGKWSVQYDLKARFKKNPFSYATETFKTRGKITGEIGAKGRFPQKKISVELKGEEFIFSGKGMEAAPVKWGLTLSGSHPNYLIKGLSAQIQQARLALGKVEILVDNIEMQARKGSLKVEKGSLLLPEIRLSSSLFKNLYLSVEIDGARRILELRGKEINWWESATTLGLLPPGWEISGRDSVQVKAAFQGRGVWSFRSHWGFQDLNFQNRDSSFVGEKVDLEAETSGELDLKTSRFRLKTTLEAREGEMLYDRFYLNLKDNPVSFQSDVRVDIPNRSYQFPNIHLEMKDILSARVSGALNQIGLNRGGNLSLTVPKTPLRNLFRHALLEPFGTEKPFLKELSVDGSLSADIKLTGRGADWAAMGRLHWYDGGLSSKEKGYDLKGIDLDLPILYQTRGVKVLQGPMKGKLSIGKMTLPFLPEQSLSVNLDVHPNGLSITSPTTIRVPGGEIQLGPVTCKDIFLLRPSVKTSITLGPIDLKPLLSEIWFRPVQGTLEGRLDPIHYEQNRIESSGQIRAKVFGGEILFTNLGAGGISSSALSLNLNARWKDLNLGELTAGTPFGKVEGVLRGEIRDLYFAYGQPQKFDLLLETDKKRGVPQRISVKALDNIARIGGGQSPFMGLAGVFASFFKEFPYKKIGVRASLENDIFRINGTIKEGGVEYLVKRGILSGVNIVNQNPDNRIRFKDMVKRIKRVTESKTGPVVK